MLKYGQFQCAEKEDRVYALMGLIPSTRRIPVKYGISAMELAAGVSSVSPGRHSDFEDIAYLLGVDCNRPLSMDRNCRPWMTLIWSVLFSLDAVAPYHLQRQITELLWPNSERLSALIGTQPEPKTGSFGSRRQRQRDQQLKDAVPTDSQKLFDTISGDLKNSRLT